MLSFGWRELPLFYIVHLYFRPMLIKETLKTPSGFFYPFRAIKIILSDWRIARLAILPFVINLILFALFFSFFNIYLYDWITQTVFSGDDLAWYWDTLYLLAGILLFIVSIGIVFFGFVIIGLVVAAPFNDFLSSAVEKKLTGKVRETKMSIVEMGFFVLKNESRKMAIILVIQLLLMALNLVPGFGQAAFLVLMPLFMACVMAFEFTGYTLDRRGFTFAEKRKYIFSSPGLFLGFGLAVASTLLLPIINFALLPLAVVGGTMLVIDNPPPDDKSDE